MAGSQTPIYTRSPLKLVRRPDRANLQIVWRDPVTGPQKQSAGTSDETLGKAKLDMLYLQMFGGPKVCPACGQCKTDGGDVVAIMNDYWVAHGQHTKNPGSVVDNLGHVRRYIANLGRTVTNEQIDKAWIAAFRKWLAADPFTKGKDPTPRFRAPSTIEGAVMQLHAALVWAKLKPDFDVLNFAELSRSPDYRADIPALAKMFRYCLYPDTPHPKAFALQVKARANLLKFLRLSVATWARPDAVLDFSLETRLRQWVSQYKVVCLNPYGRVQTKKRRASVPVSHGVAAWLDSLPAEPLFKTRPTEKTWANMIDAIGLGGMADGEAGFKLIRRSMATLGRARLGEADWVQGQMMLGHVKTSQSDTYALPKVEYLGKALAVTASIIDDIEALCPGAFGGEAEAEIVAIIETTGHLRSRQSCPEWDAWREKNVLAPLPELPSNVVSIAPEWPPVAAGMRAQS